MNHTRQKQICDLLGIELPIIQAGMVWVSGAKLAAASSNAGILGVIGAGSMNLDLLRVQIQKAQALTTKPFAINIPLLYKHSQEQIELALEEGVRLFITSAGSPKTYTRQLKDAGCTVLHVVSTPKLAEKCEEAGVDAVIAEGFEAGGHNGRDELTTFVLIPQVLKALKTIPVLAAGGIADGRGIAAAFALGAAGVQMGTRFVATLESRAHPNFKAAILRSRPEDTNLCMKKLVPVRLLKNKFFENIKALEEQCASGEELQKLLGKGRARLGMHEGDLDEGELEIGQISGYIDHIKSVAETVDSLRREYSEVMGSLPLSL
ncbi:MAG: nitronate monooxygenase [Oligoflexales bacterium]|nr:nitronate monooxygenase [Oligoflexales bacterium]